MSNRRNYGGNSGNYGGNSGGGGGGGGGRYGQGGGNSGVSPWQSGSSSNRSLLNNNLLNQLTSPDSQLALATKLLSSILPVQQGQPPSLMSLGSGNFGGNQRFGSGYGNDRGYRRDDRRGDQFRNRRPANDRNRDRKSGEKPKPKKSEDEAESKEERNDDAMEGVKEDDGDNIEKTQEGPLPGYENIPSKLFHCHICGKSMWNDVSFDTHVKGRNHRNKLRDVEDGYLVQTDLMRQIAALSLKLEEIRRGGKRRPYPEQYCKMCDLHFNGMTMFAHRSTEEHQNLKRFIHPSCDLCNLDFQVRIEYDEHILTPGHLQAEAKALARKEKYEKDPKFVALREQEAKMRLLLEEVGEIGKGAVAGLSEEDQKLISEVLSEEGEVPAYDPDSEVGVARHHVEAASGFLCKVCKIFLLSPEVVDIHCRTQKHYEAYVNQLKIEASKRSKENEKEDPEKRKPEEEEDSGAPKRRKTDSGSAGVNGDGEKVKEEPTDEKMDSQETDGGEAEEDEKEAKPAKTPTRRGRGRAARK